MATWLGNLQDWENTISLLKSHLKSEYQSKKPLNLSLYQHLQSQGRADSDIHYTYLQIQRGFQTPVQSLLYNSFQNLKGLAQKLAPKKNLRYTRANPDPNPPTVFENPNTIPKLIRNQQKQDNLADLSPETVHPNPISTPIKVIFRSTPNSPISPSTSQSPPPTSSSPIHIPLTNTLNPSIPFTPVVPTVPFVPVALVNPQNLVNMAMRYAPLQLPANPVALPRDYQAKISYFDSTGPYSTI